MSWMQAETLLIVATGIGVIWFFGFVVGRITKKETKP